MDDTIDSTADSGTVAKSGVSRRSLLTGAGAAGALAAGAAIATVAHAQQAGISAPPTNFGAVAGMPFRALVRHGREREVMDLRLREMKPRQVMVRTRASCACYSIGPTIFADRDQNPPMIPNHSSMGVVEAVGPDVRRVQVGDRVVVSGTPWCGVCYQCLNGAPEWCGYHAGGLANDPVAETEDGTAVIEMSTIGGISEITIAYEEYCVPVFTDIPDEHLAMLGDTFAVGLAATSDYYAVDFGDNVVIFGAGPVGLAAVQGARARQAGQIIVIEPVAYRREAALNNGATTVIDPNEDTNGLIDAIRDLCSGPTERLDAGGRIRNHRFIPVVGADLVVEASGGDLFPPAVEVGPDPTGLLALRQAWEVTRGGGHLVTLAAGQAGNIDFPTSAFCLSGRRIYGGQMGGMNVMRETPRYVSLIETGAVDPDKIITRTVSLDEAVDGFQGVIDRTELGVVVTFP